MEGSRGPTQIHIRGLCHWAGEPACHLSAEPPSRRTSEPRKVQEERFFVVVFARRGGVFERFLTGRRGHQGGFSPDGEATREV